MAGGNDLNVSLKITGDASGLSAAAQQAQADIDKIGQASQRTSALARDTASYLSSEAKSLEDVAERRNAYNEALKTGVLNADQFFVATKQLATQEQSLKTDLLEAAGAVSHFNLNTSQARIEIGRLIKDIATDQPARFAQSFTTLTAQTGLLAQGLSFLVSPLGIIIAAAGAAAATYIYFAEQSDRLEKSLAATGNFAASSADQLKLLATQAEQSDGHIRGTSDAVIKLAESGKFAGEDLQLAGQGAAAFANLTGTSIDKAVGLFEKLRDDPLKTLAELDAHYHFLSVDQIEQIAQLEQMGDKAGAASLAIKAFADAMVARDENVKQALSGWAKLMDQIATSAHNAEDRVAGFLDRLANAKGGFSGPNDVLKLVAPGSALLSELLASATGTNGHQFDNVVGGSGTAKAIDEAANAQAKFNSYLAQTQVAVDKEVTAMQRHVEAMNQSKEAIALENQNRALEEAYLAKGAPLTDAETAAIERQHAPLIALARDEDNAAAAKKASALAERELATARREAALDLPKLDDMIAKLTEDTSPLAKITANYNQQLDFLAAAETHFHDAGLLTADVLAKLEKAYELANQKKQDAIEKQQILNQLHIDEGNAIDQLLEKYSEEERSITDLSDSWQQEKAEIDAVREADKALQAAVNQAVAQGNNDLARSLEANRNYYEQLARMHADRMQQLKEERSLIDSWAQSADQDLQGFFQEVNQGGSVLKSFGNLAKEVFQQILFEIEKLAFINPLLNALFGGSRPGLSTAGGALGLLFNGGGGGGDAMSIVSQIAGGGSASGGSGFSLFSPSSWIDAGKNLYSGFTSLFGGGSAGAISGAGGGTLLDYGMSGGDSTLLNYGAAGTNGALGFNGLGYGGYGSALGQGLGIAGGVFAGYNAYQNAGGGIGGLGAAAAYGYGTYALGAAASTAFAGGISAGLGAIPVVGWVAIAAMLIDKFSGGKLFGTGYQTKSSDVSLNIGPSGGDAVTTLYQEGQKALFGGTKRRTKTVDSSQDAIDAANQLFDAVEKVMTADAKALAIDVPPVIDASLQTITEYDKKGHAKSTKYLVDAFGKQWEEATAEAAQKRIFADATIATVAATTIGKDAQKIAEQWQSNADKLADGAALLVQATADLQNGKGLLGLNATLADTVDVVQKYETSSESLVQTYARLQEEVSVVKTGFDTMGLTLKKTGADLVKLADDFSNAAGGAQAAAQLQQSFEQAFYSPAEIAQHQADALRNQLTGDLSKLGLGPDTTLAQFRSAFEAIASTLNGADLEKWEQTGVELKSYFDLLNQVNSDQLKNLQGLVQSTQQIAAQLFGTSADQIQAKINALIKFGNEGGFYDFRQINALKKQLADQQAQQQAAQQLSEANALLGNFGQIGALTGQSFGDIASEFNVPLDKLATLLHTDQAGLQQQFQTAEDQAKAALGTEQNTKYANELLADILAQQQGQPLPYSPADLKLAQDGGVSAAATTAKPGPALGAKPPGRSGSIAAASPGDSAAAASIDKNTAKVSTSVDRLSDKVDELGRHVNNLRGALDRNGLGAHLMGWRDNGMPILAYAK